MRDQPVRVQLLTSIQRDSVEYFIKEVIPNNDLVKDMSADNWPASIAAVGLTLTAFPAGV